MGDARVNCFHANQRLQTSHIHTLWDLAGDATHAILQQLPKHDLCALTLVNHATHELVAPYLYSSYTYRRKGRPRHDVVTFFAYLRTILKHPDLARHVRQLTLNWHVDWEKGPWFEPIAGADASQAARVVDDIVRDAGDLALQWKDDVRRGRMDALSACLISQMSNLRQLELGGMFTRESLYLGHLLRLRLDVASNHIRDSCPLRHLLKIKHSHYCPNTSRQQLGNNTGDVLLLFHLPGVRDLSVGLDNPETFSWPYSVPPDASNLITLCLTDIREQHLHHILAQTTNLKSLSWMYFYVQSDRHTTNQPVIRLDVLASALDLVRDSLENLKLYVRDITHPRAFSDNSPRVDIAGSLRLIRHFPRLRTLDAPMCFLTGAWTPETMVTRLEEVVPRFMTHLLIHEDLYPHARNEFEEEGQNAWDLDEVTEECCRWATTWLTENPGLLKVTYVINFLGKLRSESFYSKLFELGRLYGVTIKILQVDFVITGDVPRPYERNRIDQLTSVDDGNEEVDFVQLWREKIHRSYGGRNAD